MALRQAGGFTLKEWMMGAVILIGAMFVMWFFMIRPHMFDWQDAGETRGEIKSLMSNQTVIGSPSIKAVVILSSGGQTIVDVPIKSDVRAGSQIILSVQVDAGNKTRKRYKFAKAAK